MGSNKSFYHYKPYIFTSGIENPMSNRAVHFEIPCDNPQKVMGFFGKAFSWTFQQFGDMEYWIGISGGEKLIGNCGNMKFTNKPFF